MMKVYYLLVLFLGFQGYCWEDMTLDDSRENSLEDYDCSVDGQCDVETNEIQIKRKSNAGLNAMVSQLGGKLGMSPYFHTTQPMTCSCGATHYMKFLGMSYHPRRIPAVVCNTESCGRFYRCHPRHYKVYVLTKKVLGLPPPEQGTPKVPDNFTKNWVFEGIDVTVGCECGS